MTKKLILYSHQSVGADDIRAVVQTLKADFLTQGPKVEEFERALARKVGARFAASFSSGTAALQGAYFAAGIKKRDEIITSPLTFAATSNAALWQGGNPVFADIEKETGNLDPKEVKKKINGRTKAIVAVDYAGLPANLAELKKIAQKNKIFLIEDAAHALGASYRGKKVGGISDLTTFSFHPVKSITTGEGGAVATNDKNLYERLVLFRNHGITRERKKLINKNQGAWYYEMQELGLNYRLTDIQAALGLSQLKKLERFINKRRKLAKIYQKELAGNPYLILPRESKEAKSSWHIFPARLREKFKNKRAEVFKKLRVSSIGAQVHYIPVYWHPYYKKLGYKKGLCPKAEEFYKTEISLPLFPDLKATQQKFIVSIVQKIIK